MVVTFLLVLLSPTAARAQDASVLAILVGPPLLLAPFLAPFVRGAVARSIGAASPSRAAALAVAWLECVLWAVCGALAANVWLAERWHLPALLALLVSVRVSWVLQRRLVPAAPPAVAAGLVAVLPALFLVVGVVAFAVAVLVGSAA